MGSNPTPGAKNIGSPAGKCEGLFCFDVPPGGSRKDNGKRIVSRKRKITRSTPVKRRALRGVRRICHAKIEAILFFLELAGLAQLGSQISCRLYSDLSFSC